ncbi:MAG: hypothetical protein ACI4S9_01715 [Christensenellales bacterium]
MEHSFASFVAIIVATGTEEIAVKHMYEWSEVKFDCDEQTYYVSSFVKDGIANKVVYARQSEMGMTVAVTLTMKLIEHFRPRYVLMAGIAAGIAPVGSAEQIYGDVVVADMIWNYASGKFVSPDRSEIRFGSVGFIPRPAVVMTDERILSYVKQAADSAENQCRVHFGVMATGSAVVTNREIVKKQIHSMFAETIGLDMEAYGVVYAAQNATAPRPIPLVIKSVCDYANSEKSDQYQKFAAYTSCEFSKIVIEKFLPTE